MKILTQVFQLPSRIFASKRKASRNILKDKMAKMGMKKIIVGASGTGMDGWVSTDQGDLNLLKLSDWEFYFKKNDLDALLAEHVWEHLSQQDGAIAAKNIYQFMKKGGYARIAVPDGYFPDQEYINYVKPGGHGAGSDDHKVLYTIDTLTNVFESVGFKVRPLEYFDNKGQFHFKAWSPDDGMISRSQRFDDRNTNGQLKYTSIIIDAIKL